MKKMLLLALACSALTAAAQNTVTVGKSVFDISAVDSIVLGADNKVTVHLASSWVDSVYDNTADNITFQVGMPLRTLHLRLNSYWDDLLVRDAAFNFGYSSLMHVRDVMTGDMAKPKSNYDWFSSWSTNKSLYKGSGRTLYACMTYYSEINQVNQLLQDIDKVGLSLLSDEYKGYAGALHAWRAMLYLDMARMYEYLDNSVQSNINEYGNDVTGLTVPIITEPVNLYLYKLSKPRAKKAEMVKFLEDELSAAEQLMAKATITDRETPNLAVVYGLKARLYLWDANYEQAASYAAKAIQAYDGKPMTKADALSTINGFNLRSKWMWGVSQNPDDQTVQSKRNNWTSWMSNEATFGYAKHVPTMIDAAMYARISDTDWRKLIWKAPSGTALEGQTPWIDASAAASLPDYASAKFRPLIGVTDDATTGASTDYPLMRVEEMYFIQAEAEAQQGNVSTAKTLLTDFMTKYRDANYATSAATQADLIDEIIFQKRVELWGEGQSYFDYKRLNMSVNRDYEGSNFNEEARKVNSTGRPVWMNFLFPNLIQRRSNAIIEWCNPSQECDSLRQVEPADFTAQPFQLSLIPVDSTQALRLHTEGCDGKLTPRVQCSFYPDFSHSFLAGDYDANTGIFSIYSDLVNDSLRSYMHAANDSALVRATLYLRGVETVTEFGAVKSKTNTVSVEVTSKSKYASNPTHYFGMPGITPMEQVDFSEEGDSVTLWHGTIANVKAGTGMVSHFANIGTRLTMSPSGKASRIDLAGNLDWVNRYSPKDAKPYHARLTYLAADHDVEYKPIVEFPFTVKDSAKVFNTMAYIEPKTKADRLDIDSMFTFMINNARTPGGTTTVHLTCDNPKVKVPSEIEVSYGSLTTVTVDCSALTPGDTVEATIAIADEDALVGGKTSQTFRISRAVVDTLKVTYTSEWTGVTDATGTIIRKGDKYIVPASLSGNGGDLTFTIKDGKTYVARQKLGYLSNFGAYYAVGSKNSSSGEAGTYDAATRTATLTMEYTVSAGSFGSFTDTIVFDTDPFAK